MVSVVPYPMTKCFFDKIYFGHFSVTSFADLGCEWGMYFALSYPKISIVLDHV